MKKISVTAISDLHGFYPKLEGGDLLIIAGDLTARDLTREYDEFDDWLKAQNYRKKVFIAGNHDNSWVKEKPRKFNMYWGSHTEEKFEYLCDSGTEFEGLKIWGSPWTAWFHGINPHCKAFTKRNDAALDKKWTLIPKDTDILITHSPPHGILDICEDGQTLAGSVSLRNRILCKETLPNLKLHVFGHIHEMGGRSIDFVNLRCVNASIVNEHYRHVNKPVRIEL